MIRTYSELIRVPTLKERFQYLALNGKVGEDIFGAMRFLNQKLYTSWKWKERTRPRIIVRDEGNELGLDGYPIQGSIHIHHLNPITLEDLMNDAPCLYDPENLICCSHRMHEAITYGNELLLPHQEITRYENDTCPWKLCGLEGGAAR